MDAKTTMIEPIRKTLEVERDAETAFRFFTEQMSEWWPLETHSRSAGEQDAPARSAHIEPRVGGRVYEVAADGAELDWGEVIAWEPGGRVAFTWRLDHNDDEPTEVDVRFTDLGGGRARVAVEHRNWENWHDGAEYRPQYDTGWDYALDECFGGYAGRAA